MFRSLRVVLGNKCVLAIAHLCVVAKYDPMRSSPFVCVFFILCLELNGGWEIVAWW